MNKKKLPLPIIGIIIIVLLAVGLTYQIVKKEDVQETSSTEETATKFDDAYQQIVKATEDELKQKDLNWIALPEIDLNNPEQSYEIKTLSSQTVNVIDLRSLSGHQVQINGEDVSGKETYKLKIDVISADNQITLTVNGTDYTINTLPETLSTYDYENNGAEDGYYYFTYDSYLVKLNTDGQVVYYNDVGSAFNFRLNKNDDGEIYYTYSVKSSANDKIVDVGYEPIKAVIMDENFKIVDELQSIIPTDTADINPLESHEFIFIDVGHYIVSSYYPEEVFNIPSDIEHNKFGTRVVTPVIQEIKDGEILFEWKSAEHPELYGLSVEHNDFTNEYSYYADYFHFNAIAIDPSDKNLIVSSRNTSTIYKLNRDTGEIMWKLGGKAGEFGLTEEQKFSRQHNLSFLSDGTIMLFNNGNVLPKAPYPIIPDDSPLREKEEKTSIMQIKVDEDEKKVLDYHNFSTGEFTATRGSVQMLNEDENIVMIGWGSRDDNDAVFSEINLSTGEELFVFYPNNEDIISYRAFKYKQ